MQLICLILSCIFIILILPLRFLIIIHIPSSKACILVSLCIHRSRAFHKQLAHLGRRWIKFALDFIEVGARLVLALPTLNLLLHLESPRNLALIRPSILNRCVFNVIASLGGSLI